MDITKYQPAITETLKKLRVPKGQRDDLTQECWLALLKRQPDLEASDDPNLASVICWRAVQDVRKAARMETKTGEDTKAGLLSLSDPRTKYKAESVRDSFSVDDLDRFVDAGKLDAALATLPPEERRVLHDIFFEGWTLDKVAEENGLTKPQVRWRKQQGIKKLKKYFKEA
jgi:RNA polymerase sigma factor (sigma-70 family)